MLKLASQRLGGLLQQLVDSGADHGGRAARPAGNLSHEGDPAGRAAAGDPQADMRASTAALEAVIAREVFGEGRDSFDLNRLALLAASLDSAAYYSDRMGQAHRARDAGALLTHAMQQRVLEGLTLEFGVASGYTINLLADATKSVVHGFDGFGGLPEDWRPGFPRGAFAQPVPAVRDNVELVIGLFDDTLPRFIAGHPGPAAFIHIDCDLYSSTRTVFEHCAPSVQAGTVIVFDEYFNYPGWRRHEFRAFQEFIEATGHRYEYLGVVPAGQQVAVRVIS